MVAMRGDLHRRHEPIPLSPYTGILLGEPMSRRGDEDDLKHPLEFVWVITCAQRVGERIPRRTGAMEDYESIQARARKSLKKERIESILLAGLRAFERFSLCRGYARLGPQACECASGQTRALFRHPGRALSSRAQS